MVKTHHHFGPSGGADCLEVRRVEAKAGADYVEVKVASKFVVGRAQCAPPPLPYLLPKLSFCFAKVSREPYGVVASVVAWNYPFNMGLYKAAIAMAGGNSVVSRRASRCLCGSCAVSRRVLVRGAGKSVAGDVSGLASSRDRIDEIWV